MQAPALIHLLQQDASIAPLVQALCVDLPDGDWLPANALLQPDRLELLLPRFAQAEGYPCGDRRAIASLWSRWHYWAVLPAYLAALLLHRCAPTVAAIQLSEGQRTCAVRWHAVVLSFSAQQAAAVCKSLVQQEQALIDTLSAHSRASPKVFWSNFGNLLEHVVSQLRAHPGVCPDTLQALEHLLSTATLSDGSANPLQYPVRYVPMDDAAPGALHRVRKICCLNYLLPETALCSNCPRPPDKTGLV